MRGIANPTIQWNGQTLAIIPNSLSYKTGGGDKVVRPVSAGGGAVTTVVTENVETKMSTLKFSIANTADNIAVARQMNDAGEFNEFQIADDELQVSFSGMALLTEPERPLSMDGEIELEFAGSPASESV